ncbi:RagB/SusD family nutrient uptake outer membrane protein [Tamlana sp. 2201CG12-4]|uniref:RagB/SusD family nutrient uptake outer membrane protein n=1 Tax=Tamlana sp. 2201CG12-4 TaxID=3112582 RepID=UPI002DBEF97A|nr:RagB/SusD family nutrient uptake outer membrane protein [Tamlana sp. 2201CG12-4]MEC3905727.1 RagB/SusD family nutrient uptake outer membrane protein [Tamlana sp. 2201CG12-4]
MKTHISKYIAIILIIGIVFNCSDNEFIDADPVRLTVDEALQNASVAEEMVYATYNAMLLGAYTGIHWIYATTVPSDNAIAGVSGNNKNGNVIDGIEEINGSLGSLNPVWTSHYSAITRANYVLKFVPELDNVEDNLKELYIAEARFIRAMTYFRLLRVFGGVPLVDHILTPGDADDKIVANVRVSKEELYEFIIDELTEVAAKLPTREEWDEAQLGRATSGAALGYLAKVYMYVSSDQQYNGLGEVNGKGSLENWSLCHQATLDVEALGYDLDFTYDKYGVNGGGPNMLASVAWLVYAENNVESVFEIQGNQGFANNAAPVINYYNWASSERINLGVPSDEIVKLYEFSDRRLNATIVGKNNRAYFDLTGQGTAGTRLRYFDNRLAPNREPYDFFCPKSYVTSNKNINPNAFNGQRNNKNIRTLRYADILLIRAEAANELGQTADAEATLNKIRLRAFGDNSHDYPTTDDINNILPGTGGDQLKSAIWRERRLELAFEHDRWFDLARQGRREQVTNDYLESRGMDRAYQSPKNDVFPIPIIQILLSSELLEQNPGY